MSSIRRTAGGTAIAAPISARCARPKYSPSSSKPIGMPPGVYASRRVTGVTDQ